jgi:hypothetical protein
LGLDDAENAGTRQDSLQHFKIARLKNVERYVRAGQQDGALQREDRHVLRQVRWSAIPLCQLQDATLLQ